MKQRILTGLIMLLVIAGMLFLTQYIAYWVYDIFVLAIMFFSTREILNAVAEKFSKPISGVVYSYIIIGYIAFKFSHIMFGKLGITTYFVLMGIFVILMLAINLFSTKHDLSNVMSTMFCMVYPLALSIYLLALNYLTIGDAAIQPLAFTDWVYDAYATGVFVPNVRIIAIACVLACSCSTDIFAYFVGSLFRGPKLAPRISPKKTISGSIGGLVGGMFGAVVVLLLGSVGFLGITPLSEDFTMNILLYLGLGFSIAIATQIGDLIASNVKRYCEIKDFSNIFPGHGGMLDRVDGIILSSLITYTYLSIFILVA